MSKTKTETPVLRNSADIPWEETRLRHKVDKRIYVLLLFFWAGAVHTAFWSTAGTGIFYLLVGWTGLGLAIFSG